MSLPTGCLTPRTNETQAERRYCGAFAQPDGFSSVLNADVRQDGSSCLTLHYRGVDDANRMWSIMLTNEQRKNLGEFLLRGGWDPVHWEDVHEGD
jgi:hypothetical protein